MYKAATYAPVTPELKVSESPYYLYAHFYQAIN